MLILKAFSVCVFMYAHACIRMHRVELAASQQTWAVLVSQSYNTATVCDTVARQAHAHARARAQTHTHTIQWEGSIVLMDSESRPGTLSPFRNHGT